MNSGLAGFNRVPDISKIYLYHITSVKNLASILSSGKLSSDASLLAQGGPTESIGMSRLKQRRLNQLVIPCMANTPVGACVPFYFAPRSVMLFMIDRNNYEINYNRGQEPIIHLEAKLTNVLDWANHERRPWAFSLSNAAAFYTEFRSNLDNLDEIDWDAVYATNWRGRQERKNAEFLVYDTFPIQLIERIGVYSSAVMREVESAVTNFDVKITTSVIRSWYY